MVEKTQMMEQGIHSILPQMQTPDLILQITLLGIPTLLLIAILVILVMIYRKL